MKHPRLMIIGAIAGFVLGALSGCDPTPQTPYEDAYSNNHVNDLSTIKGLEGCKVIRVALSEAPYTMNVVRCGNSVTAQYREGKQTETTTLVEGAPLVTQDQLEATEAARQENIKGRLQQIDEEIAALQAKRELIRQHGE